MEAAFPELTAERRAATRLHPRRGTPTAQDSSVGGVLLWPADEPWPRCTVPHKRSSGYRISDVLREREILERAWRRDPRSGPNSEESEILAGFKRGRHAPHLADTDPIPMLAVAQLYRRDVPGLPHSEQGDLLQVFWCPFEKHGDSRHDLHVQLRWRHARDVVAPLEQQPAPEVVGRQELVPSPCVLHPEGIVEHPYFTVLPSSLQTRIDAWEGPEEDDAPQYIYDLSTAPGWKAGGYLAWRLTPPQSTPCLECSAELSPVLTLDEREWDPGTTSWIPLEDRPYADVMDANTPTWVSPGRGRLVIAACPNAAAHPLRLLTP
ncbi:hypothetical protein [Streptomyces sp. SID14478]|uniref:hypothetical protein n=1 Tax=Streptomyces sp. SID14478 TaxID=2706073 RepID=UPI0031BB5551